MTTIVKRKSFSRGQDNFKYKSSNYIQNSCKYAHKSKSVKIHAFLFIQYCTMFREYSNFMSLNFPREFEMSPFFLESRK